MLSELSPIVLFILGLFTVVGTLVLGFVTDAILRDRGFGPILNGLLVLAGSAFGVWTRLVLLRGA